jgi:hypothetical protein
MADWSLPTLSSTYANYLTQTTARDVDCAVQFSTGTITNVPTGAIKFDTSLLRWQKWSGTAWGELATTYQLTGLTCTSFSNTGNTTLGDASADTITINANTVTYNNATTIAGTLTYTGAVNWTGNVTFGDAVGDTMTFNSGTATIPNGLSISGGTLTATLLSVSTTFKINGNTVAMAAGTSTITLPTATDTLVGRATTDTLTNKRVTSRIGTTTSAATITPVGDSNDQYNVTALAVASTIAAPSGTPTDGQKLTLRIKATSAVTLTWTITSGAYRAIGATLPTTTVATKTLYIGCIYNAADAFWDVIAVAQQA